MLYFTQFGTERIFKEMKQTNKQTNPETKQQNQGSKHGLYLSVREWPFKIQIPFKHQSCCHALTVRWEGKPRAQLCLLVNTNAAPGAGDEVRILRFTLPQKPLQYQWSNGMSTDHFFFQLQMLNLRIIPWIIKTSKPLQFAVI